MRGSPPSGRSVATNWEGTPCPACATRLGYLRDLPSTNGEVVLVLLRCQRGHCWQETLNLETLHSGVFVERRKDLEDGVPPTG
jgi:hypothetical protein